MSLMVVGAIVALIIVVMGLGGSRLAKQYAIGLYSLAAAFLLAIGIYYFMK